MRKAKFWFKNEKEVMRRLGFEPVEGSGSGWVHKEDGESDVALAQLKSTEAESYRINYLDVQKLEYHAAVAHKLPVFVIEFLNRGTYIMINASDLDKIDCLLGGKHEESVRFDKAVEAGMEIDVMVELERQKKIKSSKQEREKFYKEREKQWSRKKKQH